MKETAKTGRDDKAATKKAVPLWRNLDYLLLWTGQSISDIGSSVSMLAFPLLMLAITHSPAQAGFVGAFNAAPIVIFSLFAGVLVDRWDRKLVMLSCDIGRAGSLASIPLAAAFGHLTVIQLYITALIEGTLVVFANLAETSSLPQVVTQEQLPAAIGQTEVTEGITALFGPPLSGLLFTLNNLLPFIADAITYAVSIVTLLLIRTPFQKERVIARRKLHAEIIEGLVWLWHSPFIRDMMLFSMVYALFLNGGTLIIIVLAERQHATPAVIGLIFAAGGIGSILGSLLAPALQKRITVGHAILLVRWIFALLWPLNAIAPNPFALGAIEFGFGAADPLEDVPYFSYRHALLPDAIRGRVISICRLCTGSLRTVGIALTGVLIQQVGVIQTILITWAGLLIVTVLMTLSASIRKAGTQGCNSCV
jgi:MFS family permease